MAQETTYTQALADAILERIADGEPLRQICRDPGMPAWRTVYNWRKANPEFEARFAQARLLGFDAIAEDILDIADDGRNDWVEKESKGGGTYIALDNEHVQRSKLRIETRLKLLAKWDPKRYGERQQVDLNGKMQISEMSDEDVRNELSELVGAELASRMVGNKPEPDDGSDLV